MPTDIGKFGKKMDFKITVVNSTVAVNALLPEVNSQVDHTQSAIRSREEFYEAAVQSFTVLCCAVEMPPSASCRSQELVHSIPARSC